MKSKIGLIVCPFLRTELELAAKDDFFKGMEILHAPLNCNARNNDKERFKQWLEKNCEDFEVIFSIGCRCINFDFVETSNLKAKIKYLSSEQCMDVLAGKAFIRQLLADGAYLTTPGWIANWQKYIHEWGFTSDTVGEFLRETTKKIVLLDTGIDPDAEKKAQRFAACCELPCEIHQVGFEGLIAHLRGLSAETVLAQRQQEHIAQLKATTSRSAEYAMIFDLFADLSSMDTEENVIDRFLMMFQGLFAPQTLRFYALHSFINDTIYSIGETTTSAESCKQIQQELPSGFEDKILDNRLLIEIRFKDERLGILEIDHFTFPEYIHRYRDLARTIGTVFGLALANSRNYYRLEATNTELINTLDQVKTLRGLLPICASCKKIRDDTGYWNSIEAYLSSHSEVEFTHSLCQDCVEKLYPELFHKQIDRTVEDD